MRMPLGVGGIVIMLSVIYAPDRAPGSPGQQRRNKLGTTDEPVAIFTSLKGGAAVEFIKVEIIHWQQLE